jgi:predicted nuclease of predicted toxin-antitoxin system
MKFLVDENVRRSAVEWLRGQGYDVVYVAENYAQLEDEKILKVAHQQNRILITNDKDFGNLVFHQRLASHGVILFRLFREDKQKFVAILEILLEKYAHKLEDNFIIVSEDYIRFRRL